MEPAKVKSLFRDCLSDIFVPAIFTNDQIVLSNTVDGDNLTVRASAVLLNDQLLHKTVESMVKLSAVHYPVKLAESSWNSPEEASRVGRTFRGYLYRNVPWPTVEVDGNTYVWRPKGIS